MKIQFHLLNLKFMTELFRKYQINFAIDCHLFDF